MLSDGHLRAIATLSAVTFFTTTLVDYQFKVVAADRLQGDALAAYFGYFSAVVGVLAIGLQLFGTSRLLNRAGVIGSLAVLPIVPGAGRLGPGIVAGTLWAASMVKGADTLFRYSVNDATTQILYLPGAGPGARRRQGLHRRRGEATGHRPGRRLPRRLPTCGEEATPTASPGSRWCCASPGSGWW